MAAEAIEHRCPTRGPVDRVARCLAVNLGYWGAGNDADNLALAREAERLGYAVVWAAEAYGSDAATVLAWAAQTERIDIGSAVFQISPFAGHDGDDGGDAGHAVGRTVPARSRRIGAGCPSWHGVRFDKPLGRTREYVEIVRRALRRERLTYEGEHSDTSATEWCGQGASTRRASDPGRHPDLSRRGRSAKSGAHRRNRRWLVGDLLRGEYAHERRSRSGRDASGPDTLGT